MLYQKYEILQYLQIESIYGNIELYERSKGGRWRGIAVAE